MASSTASYASGEVQPRTVATSPKGDEIVGKISGKRRTTVVLSQQPRPVFVAEADFKAAKYFTRVKKCLLVLTGTDLVVLNVAALDEAEAAAAAGDMSVGVLRLVSFHELLEVSICGNSSLKVEYADTADKPKMTGAMLEGLGGVAGATGNNCSSDTAGTSLAGNSVGNSDASSCISASQCQGTAIRVTYDSFTLAFKEPATAQEAAAALLFHRAQFAAVRQWLNQGLHAGLRCDPVTLQALPLDCSASAVTSSTYSSRQVSSTGDDTPISTAAAPAAMSAAAPKPAPYPWSSVSSGWGSSVPLPASWGGYLDAAGEAANAASDEPEIKLEDLSYQLNLDKGPEALQLTISTPLGIAKAIITPQHVRAALLNSQCREVLAVPARYRKHSSSSKSSQSQNSVGFEWTVRGKVPAGVSLDGSTGSLASATAGVTLSATSSTSAASGFTDYPNGAGGFNATHSMEAYAAVTVEVVRTPRTAGKRGAGKVYDPQSRSKSSNSGSMPPATAAAAADVASDEAQHAQQGYGSTEWGGKAVQLQLAGVALLVGLIASQVSSAPAVALLQLLLVAILAVLQWQVRGTSITAASPDSTTGGRDSSTGNAAAAEARSRAKETAGSPFAAVTDVNSSSEDINCCGWSLKLVSGDVVSVPGRHLQLQISMARADKGLAALRQRLASMTSYNMSLTGTAPVLSVTAGVPMLVSDPEPAWLTPDTKQRFLNAKPTLEASREQAQRTHRWRERCKVDTVLQRPCPGFDKIVATFPTYLLLDNSPDGHAVMVMKVGTIKDLCDLVFNPPDGVGVSLAEVEQALAVLNEYMVLVAAPNPLPAGFQVQVYDMEGFKLSYVMGDMITLFKMLVRFGHYYPERLQQALVINAPSWFTYPYKLLSSFLDANTSAKVVVVGNPKSALSTIAHHMGGVDNVPVAWGGNNKTPLPEFPAHKRMMEFGVRLNAGEQPFVEWQQKQQQRQ